MSKLNLKRENILFNQDENLKIRRIEYEKLLIKHNVNDIKCIKCNSSIFYYDTKLIEKSVKCIKNFELKGKTYLSFKK